MKKNKIKKRILIREGYKLFRKVGYHDTNVELVAFNAKTAKGTFYFYFKNKEHLAESVLDYYISIITERVERILFDYQLTPKQRIVKLYSDYIDWYTNSGDMKYRDFALSLMKDLGENNVYIKEKVQIFLNDLKEMHVKCLQQARRLGEIDKTLDAEKIALLILCSWEGAVLKVGNSGNYISLFAFREILRDFILK